MIIGTAGHIDHGKTSLIRALTGFETDRLKEEKQRGMSIDLGFAYIDLEEGKRAGIVDVPGHEDFVRNMVAGAHGMDVVLLVIAADDGIMPQTKEHLDIIDLLGVDKGIVAITKIDCVEPSRVEQVKEDARELLKNRGIESSPIVSVSSKTGEGIDELKQLLRSLFDAHRQDLEKGFFRMPVDRSFTMKGFGTVVTGTVVSGKVSVDDKLRLFPTGRKVRVRNLEAYGEKRQEIMAGERCAVNLSDIDKESIKRGDVISSVQLTRTTNRFDAKIKSAPFNNKTLKPGEKVHLHSGTADVIAIFYSPLGKELAPETEGYASFALEKLLHVMRGDNFVIRDYSAQKTIGGGVVLNPFSFKVQKKERPDHFKLWEGNEISRLTEDIIGRGDNCARLSSISENLNIEPDSLLSKLEETGGFRITGDNVVLEKFLKRAREEALHILETFHNNNQTSSGMEGETLRQKLSSSLSTTLFKEIIDNLLARNSIKKEGELLALKGHGIVLSREEQTARKEIQSLLIEKGYQTASEAVLAGNDRKKRACLQALVKEGAIVQLSKDNYIASQMFQKAKSLALSHFERNKTINVIEFKNILETGRKGAILLLEYFDNIHLTVRRGDERLLLRRLKEDSKPAQAKT